MDNSKQQLDQLAGKKIYFGHQSVGFNIIDGIKDILSRNSGLKLNIKETRDLRDFSAPIFAHSVIGRNREPVSKIEDFKKILESGIGDKVDIAFFKFCFVDVIANTDIDNLFKYYVSTVSALEAEYPKVKIVGVEISEEVVKVAIEHLKLNVQYKGEEYGVKTFRKHYVGYLKGLSNIAPVRSELMQYTVMEQVIERLQKYLTESIYEKI